MNLVSMSWTIRKPAVLKEKLHLLKLNLAKRIGICEGMQVLDVGCGQGTFTTCIAKLVGETGKVVAVDITDEYLKEMDENLDKYNVSRVVNFVKADAAHLSSVLIHEEFDAIVSYRFIEELTQPHKLSRIIVEMVKLVRQNGMVAMIELSTKTRNMAEDNLIRLHRDIGGDYFPAAVEILQHMKNAGLKKAQVETIETNIWYSPAVYLKGNISQDEFWEEFRERIMKELWPSVKRYGMKYPPINIFSGRKPIIKD